jgi:hypothetical protein
MKLKELSLLETSLLYRDLKGKSAISQLDLTCQTIIKDYNPSKITLQEAIYSILEFRIKHFPTTELLTDNTSNPIYPQQFIINEKSQEPHKNTVCRIGEEDYSPFVTMQKAVEAEKLAIAQGKYGILYLYLVACGSKKPIFKAIKTLLNNKADEVLYNQLNTYYRVFETVAPIAIRLDQEYAVKMGEEPHKTRISLLFKGVKGGDLAYAVPFQLFMDYSSIG